MCLAVILAQIDTNRSIKSHIRSLSAKLLFAPNEPSRESFFLRRGGQLVDKKAVFVLKFVLKNGQNRLGSWREVWLTS